MDNGTTTNYNPMAWDWSYLLGQAATFGMHLLGAIAIFVIGYFVAAFLAKMLDKVLERVGFDRMIERGGIKRAMSGTGWDPSTLVSKVVFYALMLVVLSLALSVFGPNPMTQALNQFIAFFPNILVAIVIVVVAAAIASAVRDIVQGAIGGLNYGRPLATAAYVGILMMGVFMALNQLHIAPEIINGLWYAMLAIVVGVTVVAVGGGGIRPMEDRWRGALGRVEREVPRLANEVSNSSTTMNQPTTVGVYPTTPATPGTVYPQNNPGNSGYVS